MRPVQVSVAELSPAEFTTHIAELIAVYAAAMRPPAELLAGRRSIMAGHAVNPGFRALAASTTSSAERSGSATGSAGRTASGGTTRSGTH